MIKVQLLYDMKYVSTIHQSNLIHVGWVGLYNVIGWVGLGWEFLNLTCDQFGLEKPSNPIQLNAYP